MKIKGWIHIQNNGDGSAGVNFFKTEEEAQRSADKELEEFELSFCDNVERFEFKVDEKGNLI